MWAAFIRAPGTPERIEAGELPRPEPREGEVLVAFAASEVNHVDLFIRSGAYATPLPSPFVIGRDLVGVVARVGADVDDFDVGDRVWTNSMGHAGRQGTFSEFVAVPAERLYHLPDGVEATAAAPVLHAAATAQLGLVRHGRLTATDTVFIGHAGGAVGTAAVQIAHDLGARVVASVAAHDADRIARLGADVAFDERDTDVAERVGRAAPGGVDLWWDTNGPADTQTALSLVRTGGRILITAGLDDAVTFTAGSLYTNDVSVRGFAISNASVGDLATAAATINTMLAAGHLTPRVGTTFRWNDAAAAHRAVQDHTVHGRVVIVP